MPNRYVRESAIESERVNGLSWQGEVFFRRLINRVDDFGRYTANLALLRASLFPLQLEKVSEDDIARLLKEAEDCGLLATYCHDGKRFMVLARWEQGRAKESKYPQAPADVCERLQTYVYTRRQMQTYVPDSDSDSDSDTDSDKASQPPVAKAPKRKFTPPSREEIEPEALKLGLPQSEIDKFIAYYGANGWKVGRNPMSSWKHALSGWASRWKERGLGLVLNASPTSGNGSRPLWAVKKEIGQRIERLDAQIGAHKANINSRNCIPDRITPEQEADLKALRAQKADLERQLDALPIE